MKVLPQHVFWRVTGRGSGVRGIHNRKRVGIVKVLS